MKHMIKLYKVAAVAILLVAGILFVGQAMYTKYRYKPEEKQVKANKKQKKDYDPVLFSLFEKACERLNPDSGEVKFAGIISISYKADTAALSVPENLPFLYASKGDDFYYLLGQTETINTGGLCVYADKAIKKVMLSAGMPAEQRKGIMDMGKLHENLLSENYDMTSSLKGNIQTVTFINEEHVSCKEYSLSFDEKSLQPVKLKMRLSNTKKLFRENAEQWLEIQFNTDTKHIYTDRLLSKKVVEKAGEGYRLSSAYRDYELLVSGH